MNTNEQNDSERLLSKTLRTWQVTAALPPRFEDKVWQRIARQEAGAPAGLWPDLIGLVSRALARPAIAAGYVTVLLLAGLAAGYWHAEQENVQSAEHLGVRYVQMMDPYQMPHH